jgi:para-aminobenzoate synthetase component I
MSAQLLIPSIVPVPIQGTPQDIYARIAAHAQDRSGLVLLESSKIMPELSGWSYVSGPAVAQLETHEGVCTLSVDHDGMRQKIDQWSDSFTALHECIERIAIPPIERPAGLQWMGGWAGYLGYDLIREVESLPDVALRDPDWPCLHLLWCDHVLAFDHAKAQWYFCTIAWPEFEQAEREQVWQQTLAAAQEGLTPTPQTYQATPLQSRTGDKQWMSDVRHVLEWIAAGDIFQANLTHRLEGLFEGDPFSLYRRLTQLNPAPFSAYLQDPDFAIASVSPERFLKLHQGRISARPIKGTRPRGETSEQDAHWQAELQNSLKDRAENLMIVDLMRNDLGRVAVPGSVNVPSLFQLEAHPSVWQMVSTVEAQLQPECNAADLLKACWPPGSMTGAPKIRAMEIIEALEPTRRGPYAGAMGYIDVSGNMDLSVIIRTALIYDKKIMLQVGAGIVSDSQALLELDETYVKARLIQQGIEDTKP